MRSQISTVPTYPMMWPFRGHLSLKSSIFSPGSSCKFSSQYIIQDHMAAHYKKLMSAKAAVDSSAPKSLHTSVKYKDQQKRDKLIQALEKYEKDLVHGLCASSSNSRSVSPGQQKARWSLLENGHRYSTSAQNNCSRTKGQQPPSNHELWIPDSEMSLFPGLQLEEKGEEYLRFLQDLTNDILTRSCYHNKALEDVFQMHIKSKRHNLDEVKRRRIVETLKRELNITDRPGPSISCNHTRRKDSIIPAAGLQPPAFGVSDSI
ncbi:spermatogenesis-associated protein 7 homolog isoform X3 [Oxyura jamaicensis]|uniref:spermatogenesis-associated protein 7 homolog isoform X3 n=1 Tax=Oxyura jamaicensis TaxID=8884 RepID=UPI0015A62777|nr:spermatogenesis-associated protein 7 homolog isoform X3 [Oxyura jamaicensis]